MNPNEQQSKNVIKGGYFNVSTKPAEPIVDSISNWGTISTAVTNHGLQWGIFRYLKERSHKK
jgi:hypothetical protein